MLNLKIKQENARVSAYTKSYGGAMAATLESLSANVSTSEAIASSYKAVLAVHSQRYGDVIIGRQ